ncbi:hypothetical protein C2845_PM03G02690 [Panicum miliaceum]|uniref:Uncharacterized protein n=1 Tax=Panicum miliaceum TaxID=4540 RepID=A0A3L6T8J3_PANMI|nr:hypothetical protein C2845_PM03G02690 [Panicum miliaceum]
MNQKCQEQRWVSRDDAFKKGTTPIAPPSPVQQLDRVFTKRNPCIRDWSSDMTPPAGNDALGAPPSCPPARKLMRAFARSISSKYCTLTARHSRIAAKAAQPGQRRRRSSARPATSRPSLPSHRRSTSIAREAVGPGSPYASPPPSPGASRARPDLRGVGSAQQGAELGAPKPPAAAPGEPRSTATGAARLHPVPRAAKHGSARGPPGPPPPRRRRPRGRLARPSRAAGHLVEAAAALCTRHRQRQIRRSEGRIRPRPGRIRDDEAPACRQPWVPCTVPPRSLSTHRSIRPAVAFLAGHRASGDLLGRRRGGREAAARGCPPVA